MKLLLRSKIKTGVYQQITSEKASWNWLNFEARFMKKGEKWTFETEQYEIAIVLLGGNFKVESNKGAWETKNGRKNVFSGVAHTLYLPRETVFTLTAQSENLDIAYGWCLAERTFDPKFILPENTPTVIFGGDNATRQFNDLIPPGFGCSRIVSREVYTPSGNWSDDELSNCCNNGVAVRLEKKSPGSNKTGNLLIVAPAATAQLIGRSFRSCAILSQIIGVITVLLGLYFSAEHSTGSGSMIALVASCIFLLTAILKFSKNLVLKPNEN